jgi:glycosyltransferase involved in cell wall biosynthesis
VDQPVGDTVGHGRVKHETNGFLFDPEREEDLVRIVRRVLAESAACESVRAAGRRHAEEWNWAPSTRKLLEFYESAIRMPRFEKPARANAMWMLAMKRAAVGGMKIFLS